MMVLKYHAPKLMHVATVCVMDDKGRMLEETAYDNMLADAKEFTGRMKREYDKKWRCCTACKNRLEFRACTTSAVSHEFIVVNFSVTSV